MMELQSAEELLRLRIGLDPTSTGSGLVTRAVRSRMKRVGLPDDQSDRYLKLLNTSETEILALVEEVVIPETWFFRDEQPFAFLKTRLSGLWRNDPERRPLRMLSVPCATGEEPYSIAMALIETGLPPSSFRVDAVDVSRNALESARRGKYTENAFRSKDLTFRSRFFRQTSAGFEIEASASKSVFFHEGNLVDPEFLSDQAPYDAIFCRNLLIYLDVPSRLQALKNLDRLLGPMGVLFVGHAEQLGYLSSRYRPAGDRGCFAFERADGERPSVPRSKPAHAKGSTLPARRIPAGPPATIPPRRDKPAITTRVPAPESKATPTLPLLDEAARLADQGKHDEAAALCERAVDSDGPSAKAFFLLGVVRQAVGERAQAEGWFEKAVYLDPGHEEALLALAILSQRRGEHAAADKYRRRAERAYQEKSS